MSQRLLPGTEAHIPAYSQKDGEHAADGTHQRVAERGLRRSLPETLDVSFDAFEVIRLLARQSLEIATRDSSPCS